MASKKVTQLRFFGDNNGYLNTSERDAIYHLCQLYNQVYRLCLEQNLI